MLVTEFYVASCLITGIAVMMAATSRNGASDPLGQSEPQAPALPREFDQLREQHAVALVSETEEGTAVAKLAGGVFGFTYTPHQESPLFHKRSYRSFEVHKLADGSRHILGFVSDHDASELSDPNRHVAIKLYPDSTDVAKTPVAIPASRLSHARGPARDDHNALALELAPHNET
jgi:hypothetical protein